MAKENFLLAAIGPAKAYRDNLRFLFLIVLVGFFSNTVEAAPLKVGVHEKPPFAFKNPDGSWTGLSVDVWRNVAARAGLNYELVEVPFEDLRSGVANGSLDAGIGEIGVTAEDEKLMDFTQPYLISPLGIAVRERPLRYLWGEAIDDFFNWTVGQFLIGVFVAMLLVSVLIWLLERRHQTGHFKGGIHGIGAALWFSAVTMTTVGYGDKTPATLAGRFIAICWMFIGVLLVSAFTATIASSMSASRLNNSISRLSDFHHLTCGVLKGSEAEQLGHRFGVSIVTYESIEMALRAMLRKEIDATVADKISLNYLQREFAKSMPPRRFEIPNFTIRNAILAIPVRSQHPDFEKINQSLLDLTSSGDWEPFLTRWLGPNHYNM
jgi:ABC-type amino acid transport substrate-binding protein